MQPTIYNNRHFRYNSVALMLSACVMVVMGACINEDEDIDDEADKVVANLGFALSNTSNSTRLTTDIVQSTDGSFRGLEEIHIYPFSVTALSDKVSSTDVSRLYDVHAISTDITRVSNARYYYYDNQVFMRGVNAFLVYGRAARQPQGSQTDIEYKSKNGSLSLKFEPFTHDLAASAIGFEPERIITSDAVPAAATKLAAYLTNIANTSGWSTTRQSELRAFYLNFINQDNSFQSNLIAGSSTNLMKYVNELYTQVFGLPNTGLTAAEITLKQSILNNILNPGSAYRPDDFTATETAVTSLGNYPMSLGLPDGSAALIWISDRFVPRTTTTSDADINAISRMAYPVELFYYANSRIKTSEIDKRHSSYTTANATWGDVLANYENDNAYVTPTTQAVALKEQLQYAVAHLEVKINKITTSTLKDANGLEVPLVTGGTSNFPLTAVIVGGQREVGFDFCPLTSSEVDVRFIYDHSHASGIAMSNDDPTSATTAHTLVLQSPNGEKEKIILEFLNNSGITFRGSGGVIYPGTHFYLIGEIDPKTLDGYDSSDPDKDSYTQRVFTQDYTTTVQVTVNSLAKAYNVLPNILSPRLEIGVELLPWQGTTHTNVPLD